MSTSVPSAKPLHERHDEQGSRDDIAQALMALQPNPRTQKAKLFADSYEQIVAALERGVPKTNVRKALEKAGLKLSAPTFKKLLERESTRHTSTNTPVKEELA